MQQYTAKNIDELLEKVAQEKGVLISDLNVEILEEKSGIFGIGSKVVAKVYCDQDIKDFLKNYLETFFNNINREVSVEVKQDERVFKITLDSDNNAVLIGKNGQRLQSLNQLTRAAASAVYKKRVNVLIDVNGYKEDKYNKLSKLAVRVAKQVQRSKVDAVLDPMPNDERKAIHNYLTNMNYVRTVSEGEGNQRRIKIVYDATKK